MIKSIQRLRKFGVFSDFSKSVELSEFREKNVIYGWNYSGKTTLSRFFAMLGNKGPNVDFPEAVFSILDQQNRSFTEANIGTCAETIEVFNSDFVASNLSWTGSDFQPILLLGEDAADAEQKIAALNERLNRCRARFAAKRRAIDAIDGRVAEAKTAGARQVKTNLQLVEAFTAAHLNSELQALGSNESTALLDASHYAVDMKLALTPEKDKLKPVAPLPVPQLALSALLLEASVVLAARPELSETIEHLRNNALISDWVEHGLALHADKEKCEFCGNAIAADRLAKLHGHFSRDLLNHKNALSALVERVKGAEIKFFSLEPNSFSPKLADSIQAHNANLTTLVSSYNEDLRSLLAALQEKLTNPFEEVSPPLILPSCGGALIAAYNATNASIKENNELSEAFLREKSSAIRRLKRHFAAQFSIDAKLLSAERAKARLSRHMTRYEEIGTRFKADIAELHARIDRSQKGRERLNERINTLLGSDSIQISVTKVNGADRFQLVRGELPARNLSDGERTAIAFAFFLTKLEEYRDLSQVIVYIDDPISSLDSNHVFQVYSMIESAFFKQVPAPGNNQEWTTTCRQVFVSTHNFEFFELLKKLPCNKNKTAYFMVRRVSPKASTLENLPASMLKYTSEYHYLFSVIHAFHVNPDKANIEHLLSLPNAMRRFVELYTYMRLPWPNSTVDQRASELFGREKAHRVTKLLHHFSHLESVERLATNTNLIADIEAVVGEVMALVKKDAAHFEALEKALPP